MNRCSSRVCTAGGHYSSDVVKTIAPALVAVVIAFSFEGLIDAQPAGDKPERTNSLNRFLSNFAEDAATRYTVGFTDLNGDGKPEAIVYLVSNEWCGSGGCTALILAQSGASWRQVTKITLVNLPIRAFATRSHGWRDLGVQVRGDNGNPGHEALLHFDGMTYPENPSTVPEFRATGLKSQAIVTSTQGAISVRARDRSADLERRVK